MMSKMDDSGARRIAIAIVAVTGLLVAALALWRVLRVREPHADIDRSRYPIAGVDISAHNGVVDFDSLAAAGIDFVYLKASEGVSFRDCAFMRNYERARAAGMAVGAYHFFRFDCDGALQCMNFLRATEGLKLDLPPAIDVEEWGNAPIAGTDIVRERLGSFAALIRATGRDVMIYTNKQGHARFVRGAEWAGESPEIWICSFTTPPLGREHWRLWQHSHIGRLPGVKGVVDLNTFNGDRRQWEAWVDSCRRAQ